MSQETSDLDQGQRARVEALNTARSILSGRRDLELVELHSLATFILDGGDLYPSVELEEAHLHADPFNLTRDQDHYLVRQDDGNGFTRLQVTARDLPPF